MKVIQAGSTDVRADDGRRPISDLDSALYMHAAHRPACTDEPGSPPGLERGADRLFAVDTGDVRASTADADPTVVVHSADVHLYLAGERLIGHDGQDAEVGQTRADLLDQIGIGAQQHDVIHQLHGRSGDIVYFGDLNSQRRSSRPEPVAETGRRIRQQ